MNERQFKKILNGNYENIPTFCIIKDYERLRVGDDVDITWKLVDGLTNQYVRVITARQAKKLISDLNLMPACSITGLGKIYDTPDKAFYNIYKGQKDMVNMNV